MFRKTLIPVAVPPVPEDWFDDVRIQVASPSGFEVSFENKSSKEIGKDVLDPRLITLQYLIENDMVINPSQVSTILNQTDVASIEELSGKISEKAYNYIVENEKNFDKELNTIVKPKSEES